MVAADVVNLVAADKAAGMANPGDNGRYKAPAM